MNCLSDVIELLAGNLLYLSEILQDHFVIFLVWHFINVLFLGVCYWKTIVFFQRLKFPLFSFVVAVVVVITTLTFVCMMAQLCLPIYGVSFVEQKFPMGGALVSKA